MLAKLKIAQKLYLMTGLTLTFLLVVSVIGFLGAMKQGELFSKYREASRAQMLVANVGEDLLQARLAAMKYRTQRDAQDAEAFKPIWPRSRRCAHNSAKSSRTRTPGPS